MHLGRSALAALFLLAPSILPNVQAADKEAWRTRSIYQLITDRFAPVSETAPALTPNLPGTCDTGARKLCGGTWRSIMDKLDYIQGMGHDAIWISPIHQNLEGTTPYGESYHGYWVTDVNKLNPHFGTEDDLKALSKALHDRGMYLMVDIVVNFAASLSTGTSEAALAAQNVTFKKPDHYHPLCWIDDGSQDSVENCWMGDGKLPLMDLATENADVQDALSTMIKDLVDKYEIDGLRIDAAKHVPKAFWMKFCGAAGVFCTGEAYSSDTPFVADYQKSNSLDSVLNFPAFFNGVKNAFQIPGRANMKDLANAMTEVVSQFPDPGVLGNFLANHDVSRFRSVTASDAVAYNAVVWQFTFDGIPITYYGEEQEIATGLSDPDQRQALWASGSGDYSTTTKTYKRLQKLNALRKFLMSGSAKAVNGGRTYLEDNSKVVLSSATDLVFIKGPVIVVLNNRVSLDSPASFTLTSSTVFSSGFVGDLYDVLHCHNIASSSNNSLIVSYDTSVSGTEPLVIMTRNNAAASGLCPGLNGSNSTSPSSVTTSTTSIDSSTSPSSTVLSSTSLTASSMTIGSDVSTSRPTIPVSPSTTCRVPGKKKRSIVVPSAIEKQRLTHSGKLRLS